MIKSAEGQRGNRLKPERADGGHKNQAVESYLFPGLERGSHIRPLFQPRSLDTPRLLACMHACLLVGWDRLYIFSLIMMHDIFRGDETYAYGNL